MATDRSPRTRPLRDRDGSPTWSRETTGSLVSVLALGRPALAQVYLVILALPYVDTTDGWSGSISQVTDLLDSITGRVHRHSRVSGALTDLEHAGAIWLKRMGHWMRVGLADATPLLDGESDRGTESPTVGRKVLQGGTESPTGGEGRKVRQGGTESPTPLSDGKSDFSRTQSPPSEQPDRTKHEQPRAQRAREAAAPSSPPPAESLRELASKAAEVVAADVSLHQLERLVDEVGSDEVSRQLEWWSQRSEADTSWARTPWGALVAACRQSWGEPVPEPAPPPPNRPPIWEPPAEREGCSLQEYLRANPEAAATIGRIGQGAPRGEMSDEELAEAKRRAKGEK